MTDSARGPAEDGVAAIRHHLRTPLNHIIGYSDLLLEESGIPDADGVELLEEIRSIAHTVLERVQYCLGPEPDNVAGKIQALQQDVRALMELIISYAAVIAHKVQGPALVDVLRISAAGREFLSFLADGQAPGKVRSSAVSRPLSPPPIPAVPTRVLVVDDDRENCDVLRRQLERIGYAVTTVDSGAEVLRLLTDSGFDLLLLDVMMPGMSGLEVLQSLKASHSGAGVPVIMMSSLDETDVAAHCIQVGADDYLLKPFDPVLLRARLHSALERKRLLQAAQDRASELERATFNLARANEDLNRFAYAASHDLQEPLRNIMTTLQLLSRQFSRDPAPKQTELLDLAVDGARRMSDLIRDLLAWSVANSGERKSEVVDTELALEDAITNLRQSIEESGAIVTHDALPAVLFDRGLLRQLFQNLIGNAVKYRREVPPRIHLRAERAANEWVFSVQDNGLGIEQQYLRNIFEPFRRLHGQTRPGTGLGLAICVRIVEGFGGRIWAESELAVGSTFFFTVAAQEQDAISRVADAVAKAAR